jgi:hypothetical protein
LHAPAQYVQQWSASLEKQLGKETTVEVGYLGAGGFHLQRSHLINNAQPGPGLIQPRRPHPKISFVANTIFPAAVASTMTSSTFPVTTVNMLENTSQSWYDAGYVNVRRRYANGLSFLANYTFAKALENAPDFRSPMFEAATPQNNDDLNAEKGPGCDIRQRAAVSAVYNSPTFGANHLIQSLTRGGIPGPDRLSADYLRLRRYRQRRNRGGRESHPRQLHRPECLRFGDQELDYMVQPRRLCSATRLYVWRRWPELGLWPRLANHGPGIGPQFQPAAEVQVRGPRRVLQRPQSHQSGNAQPLR